MDKLLKNESHFAGMLGFWLSGKVSKEQKRELEQMFRLDYNGLNAACNRYMERTIKALDKEILSLEGFSVLDDEKFSVLLNSERLNRNLQKKLFRMIQKKSQFLGVLSPWLLDKLPEKEKVEFEETFRNVGDDPVKACNRYMSRTILAIEKSYITKKGFTAKKAMEFSALIYSPKLDKGLQKKLSHLILELYF